MFTMTPTVIAVENLEQSGYLIGAAERRHETLAGSLVAALSAPVRNARNIARLDVSRIGGDSPDILWALNDVSFEIRRGEVLGIIGRNGAGKSTLLKVLSRITEPTSGRVGIKGRVSSLLEVGTGFHPELSGRDNVYMNGTLLGMTKREIDRKFDEIVAFSGVERFLDTPVKRYSSGMQVRLAFAVAAHLDPDILIVDEVLAVGDHEFQKKCLGKMQEVTEHEGRTILFVSHDMRAVSALCSRAIFLRGGRIADDGAPADVVARYYSETAPEGECSFAPDESKAMQLLKARTVDGYGRPQPVFGTDEVCRIEMEYIIRRPVRAGTVACILRSPTYGHLLSTGDWDCDPGILERPRQPGRYTASVELPSPLLNAGMYTIAIGLGSPPPTSSSIGRNACGSSSPRRLVNWPSTRDREGGTALLLVKEDPLATRRSTVIEDIETRDGTLSIEELTEEYEAFYRDRLDRWDSEQKNAFHAAILSTFFRGIRRSPRAYPRCRLRHGHDTADARADVAPGVPGRHRPLGRGAVVGEGARPAGSAGTGRPRRGRAAGPVRPDHDPGDPGAFPRPGRRPGRAGRADGR